MAKSVAIESGMSGFEEPLHAIQLQLRENKTVATGKDQVVETVGSTEDIEGSDAQPVTTTKWEVWAYYLYYVGNSGLGPFNFGPALMQNLLSQAADSNGLLPFATPKSINAIVLEANGISFAIQCVLFLILGSFADYGRWRRVILIVLSILAWADGFAWLGVTDPTTLTFWTAAFPSLVRDLPILQASRCDLTTAATTPEAHAALDSYHRNRLSNMSFYVCSCGELLILAIVVGIMYACNANGTLAQNTRANAIILAFASSIWILVAIPWFILEKPRLGQQMPKDKNYFTVSFWNIARATKIIGTLQYEIASYSTLLLTYLLLTYLLIVGISTQALGIHAFWSLQKHYHIPTKSMLLLVVLFLLLLIAWGCIGITSPTFGFKHLWEIWAYQAFYGFLVCPWYAYSQTMISELVPHGKEFLFFALFSIVGKTSSFVGPFVSSAIVERSGNGNMPFAFLMGLAGVGVGVLWFVDVERSRGECERFLREEGDGGDN
ncbi:hypothetical protein SAICODRAFT_4149 [Saitoella complicata NRRL Y-17804]|uniref:uncharacterized protein n=1 Tax=Saitoella complicata (strain BCRC 22490 / CBS 7301 / JCM 7358 / NBRC 10748 / NRRL Y-17804) TaxID=698492 RepID=UPI00086746EB|nr:uncharacterized protein SAICODRAFT_4149 [Saitoella complicata NRRL Y-17804]ODQ55929.1 hypothetical protein SAICODRAFT_4149 [Saitoella complicata NRRL Y-17804]